MIELRRTRPDASPSELLSRLDEDGYLFLPGLLPPAAVEGTRADVLAALANAGWLADGDGGTGQPSPRACPEKPDNEPEYFRAYEAVQRLQRFHELAHHATLTAVMERLLGTSLLVHPRKVARIGLPDDDLIVAPHQDLRFNQGTPDTLTAWIPLGACPGELGGLRVLPGSHRQGLRPVRPAVGVGGLEIDGDVPFGDEWATTDFDCGDVLVFHSLTVHAAKPNRTDRLRLSVDFRYQAATEPVVEPSLRPHYYPSIPSYDELSGDWTSTSGIATPEGLTVVPRSDRMSTPDEPIRSRLITLAGADAS